VRQTVSWASEHPASERAQYDLGSVYVLAHRYAEANEVFKRAQALAPGDAQFLMARVLIACLADEVSLPVGREGAESLARTQVRPVVVNLLDDLVERLEAGTCRRVDADYALALVEGFLSNPKVDGLYRRASLHIKGRLRAVQGDLDGAVRAFEASDEISPNLVSVQMQAAWLLSADLHEDALRAIQKGRRDPRWRPWERAIYASFFDNWERQVREAAHRKGIALGGGT
jgi:tetratricopeptide (TPR) repeat protein